MTKCNHITCRCLACGKEADPAQLLASRPRHRDAAAQEQSRQAGKLGGRPKKEVQHDNPQ